MKKRFLSVLIALCMVISILPTGALAAQQGVNSPETLLEAVATAQEGDTIVLEDNITQSISIANGQNITLDLNGYTLTNTDDQHTIFNEGTLTIIDSSDEKQGAVDNVSHARAAVYNEPTGVVTINAGSFLRSKENGQGPDDNGGNSYYVILNHGTMTVNDGVMVKALGKYSSLFENGWIDGTQNTTKTPSILLLNGGTYVGGLNTIKNDDYGELTINDGSFENFSQSCFLNWNVAEVNGGEFIGDQSSNAVILNGYINSTSDQGALTINGGSFQGEYIIERMAGSGSTGVGSVSVNGGDFQATQSIVSDNFPLVDQGGKGEVEVFGGSFNKEVEEFLGAGVEMEQQGESYLISSVFPGQGTKEDPLVISDVDELKAFAGYVNEGNSYAGKYISLEGGTYDLSDEEWTPIGTQENPFSGRLDGSGAVISGLKLTKTDSGNEDIFYGLFGFIQGKENPAYDETSDIFSTETGAINEEPISEDQYTAGVTDLTLRDVEILTDGSQVAALAGCTYHAYISDIQVESGSIIGTNSIGGVVGRGYSSVIKNATTGADLTIDSGDNTEGSVYNFGGIVGSMRKDGSALSAIIDCVNNANIDVFLSSGGLGGIVGQVPGDQPLVVYNCTNTGDLTVKDTISGEITNAYNKIVGGIGGLFQGDTNNVIAKCSNSGAISGGTENAYVGALAGIANYYSGMIYECSNSGDVSGYSYYSAGMVGHGSTVTVVGSDNSGSIATSLEAGYTSSLVAGASNVIYKDMEFADTAALSDALVKAAKTANKLTDTAAKLNMEGVTVADPTGTLELPMYLETLTNDSKLCDTIVVGDRTVSVADPYQNNINVNLGVPGAAVAVAADKEIAGKLTLSADGMKLENSGSIQDIAIEGNSVEAVNLNTVVGAVAISGSDVTFYNGTEETRSASLNRFSTTGKNTIAYNYGTIDRGTEGGHTLSFGMPSIGGTTAVFHNYGTVIGGGVDGTANYIIYAPRFDSVKINNYQGSTMQKGGHWFISYGSDELSNTSGEFTGTKGLFIFQYAEDTVKDANGTINNDVNENQFVGRNNTDLDLRILKLDSADPIVKIGDATYSDLDSAFQAAVSGDQVEIVKDSLDLTQAIPEGIEILVSDQKRLHVPEENLAQVLASQGTLRVEAGGTIDFAGNILTGDDGMLEITEGSAVIEFATQTVTLQSGSQAVICEGKKLNLMFAQDVPVKAVIENGATLTVNGQLKIPATGTGAVLTVDGKLEIAETGLVQVGSKATLDGSGTVTNIGSVTLHKSSDHSATLDIDIALEPEGVVYSQLGTADVGDHIKNSARSSGSFTVPGVTEDDGTTLIIFNTRYEYHDDYVAPSGGWGSSSSSQSVVVSASENGTVKVSSYYPSKGSIVTITATPDEGYEMSSLTATDKDGNQLELTRQSDGRYTFTMPAGKVTVRAVFVEAGTEIPDDSCDGGVNCPSHDFVDVDHSLWYHEAIDYVVTNNIMNGTGTTTFAPNGNLSRAMMVQVLYNLENKPAVSEDAFTDVSDDSWYFSAVNWAASEDIVGGYGNGRFGPDDSITREQMAAILYRYAAYKGYDVSGKAAVSDFTDAGSISSWATDAVAWAVNAQVLNGKGNGILDPRGTATRAEVAQIMMNFLESMAK